MKTHKQPITSERYYRNPAPHRRWFFTDIWNAVERFGIEDCQIAGEVLFDRHSSPTKRALAARVLCKDLELGYYDPADAALLIEAIEANDDLNRLRRDFITLSVALEDLIDTFSKNSEDWLQSVQEAQQAALADTQPVVLPKGPQPS